MRGIRDAENGRMANQQRERERMTNGKKDSELTTGAAVALLIALAMICGTVLGIFYIIFG